MKPKPRTAPCTCSMLKLALIFSTLVRPNLDLFMAVFQSTGVDQGLD